MKTFSECQNTLLVVQPVIGAIQVVEAVTVLLPHYWCICSLVVRGQWHLFVHLVTFKTL